MIYLFTAILFFAIDMLWLGVVAKDLYRAQLGSLLAPAVYWPAALTFYAVFACGLMVFAILPAIEKHSWIHAVLFGALFGGIAYATYDLTNLATIKGWPVMLSVIDIFWGAFLSGSVAFIVYTIIRHA